MPSVFIAGSVLCPFLEDHKEDILCGPVWLASGLDLSGHSGMLSLTSPKLVKGNSLSCVSVVEVKQLGSATKQNLADHVHCFMC